VPLKPRKKYYKWLTVAASLILAIGFYTYNNTKSNTQEEEALLAYYQTKKALQMVSNNFNIGAEKVAYLNEFENVTNQIFKSQE